MSKVGPIVAAVAALALVALLAYGQFSKGDDTSLDAAVQAGETPVAPDRELPPLEGSEGPTSLAELKGKPVVVVRAVQGGGARPRARPPAPAARRRHRARRDLP